MSRSQILRTIEPANRTGILRRWSVLLFLSIFAADGIYAPIHLLSETHHDELSLIGLDHCGRGIGKLRAGEEDHHSSHEPHSVGDHLPNLLRPQRMTLCTAIPQALALFSLSPDRAPIPGAPLHLRSVVRPGPSPPPTPLKPRAPPPA